MDFAEQGNSVTCVSKTNVLNVDFLPSGLCVCEELHTLSVNSWGHDEVLQWNYMP